MRAHDRVVALVAMAMLERGEVDIGRRKFTGDRLSHGSSAYGDGPCDRAPGKLRVARLIVGDGKSGCNDAFLTGTMSGKMLLHARRIRIDSPGGGRVDVKAPLPSHFAESLASLGFDLSAGDMPLDEDIATGPSKDDIKRAARQHAKGLRKERRGERRSRGQTAPSRTDGKTRK